MGKNVRTYNCFEYWSVDDCRCEFCKFYPGKNHPCPLEVCDIEDIRMEAWTSSHSEAVDTNRQMKSVN